MLTLIIIHFIHKCGLLARIRKSVRQLFQRTLLLNAISTIILLCIFNGIATGQRQIREYSYIIWKGNDSIGRLKTMQLIQGNKTINNLESKVEVNLLIDFKINERVNDVYYNNILSNGVTARTINGREKLRNAALKISGGYLIKKKGEADIKVSGIIYHSVSCLYFDEPDDYNIVYLEVFQQYATLKKTEPHKYLLESPNGNRTYFSYKRGILVQVRAETSWATLIMELENSLASK